MAKEEGAEADPPRLSAAQAAVEGTHMLHALVTAAAGCTYHLVEVVEVHENTCPLPTQGQGRTRNDQHCPKTGLQGPVKTGEAMGAAGAEQVVA